MKRNAKQGFKALWIGMLALGALHCGSAWAQGLPPNCTQTTGTRSHTVSQTANVVVGSNVAPGDVVGQGSSTTADSTFECVRDNSQAHIDNGFQQDVVAPEGTYEFLVKGKPSGVAMRLFISDTSTGNQPQKLPFRRSFTLPTGTFNLSATLSAELVRTSNPMQYGTIDDIGKTLASSVFYNDNGPAAGNPLFIRQIKLGNFTLAAPSCTIDPGSLTQTVQLGSYTANQFANATPSPWAQFDLKVDNCSDPNVVADITFGAATDGDPINNNLYSMNQDGPKGLGIQIATRDNPSADMLPGVTRTFPHKDSGQSYPFQARLVPTGQVTPGTIKRPVTVTVNFR
jgi:hypothetical protein